MSETKVPMLQTWRLAVTMPLMNAQDGWNLQKVALSSDMVHEVWLLMPVLNKSVSQVL